MTGIQSNEQGQGPGSNEAAQQHQGDPQGNSSGFGAASAFARMRSQREQQAWQRPADDAHASDQSAPTR